MRVRLLNSSGRLADVPTLEERLRARTAGRAAGGPAKAAPQGSDTGVPMFSYTPPAVETQDMTYSQVQTKDDAIPKWAWWFLGGAVVLGGVGLVFAKGRK
jgi:hypothetical protein